MEKKMLLITVYKIISLSLVVNSLLKDQQEWWNVYLNVKNKTLKTLNLLYKIKDCVSVVLSNFKVFITILRIKWLALVKKIYLQYRFLCVKCVVIIIVR
jgi:hypothetical protein